jgi:hypothetical protein
MILHPINGSLHITIILNIKDLELAISSIGNIAWIDFYGELKIDRWEVFPIPPQCVLEKKCI